jgi:hypothetical protein
MDVKEPAGRLARWALKLQGLDFTIQYRKGLQHGNADATAACGTVEGEEKQTQEVEGLAEAQQKDPVIGKLWRALTGEEGQGSDIAKWVRYGMFGMNEGVVCHFDRKGGRTEPFIQKVVPKAMVDRSSSCTTRTLSLDT